MRRNQGASVAKLAVGIACLAALRAGAAPFLVADVCSPDADTCVFTTSAGAIVTSTVITDAGIGLPACSNRVCKVDLAGSPVGQNSVKLRLRDADSVWGDSPDVPFSFARPASISSPSGMRLVP